jgi:hypothetical protein
MNPIPKRSVFITTVVLSTGLMVAISQKPVSAQGGAGASRGGDQKMEDVYLNIKSFRGQSAELLNPTMVMFEAALGVGCGYCHDNDAAKRDLDSKPQKDVARRMIAMVNTLNASSFGGTKKVTCFTCHNGRPLPIGTPNVVGQPLPPALGEDYVASRIPAPSVPTAITVDQILDKYLAAVGGAAAVQKAPSLTAVGTMTQYRIGRPFPAQQVEIASKAPGMQLITTRAGQNDNLVAYSASGAWAKGGNGAPRDLRKAEADATRLQDAYNLPSQLKQLLLEPKMDRPQVIRGGEVYVITGHTQNLPRVTAYFEKESGMLARLVYDTDTAFGVYPTQIEYSDYRDVGGRKVPYTWVISEVRNRQFTWVMQNVRAAATEDSKFAKPATATAAR